VLRQFNDALANFIHRRLAAVMEAFGARLNTLAAIIVTCSAEGPPSSRFERHAAPLPPTRN
jgi:hypothetical protein